jgi:glycosyltransferase involved in cell wall biosynthesis
MYNYYLAHALVRLGHSVTVVSARVSADDLPREADGPVSIHRVRLPKYHRWFRRVPLLSRYARALEQFVYCRRVADKLGELTAADCVDVVEFADVNAEGFLYLRKKDRRPVVVRCHTPTFVLRRFASPGSMEYDTRVTSWMETEGIRAADALTAPSGDMAHVIEASCGLPSGTVRVIPNALDVEMFHRDAQRTDSREADDLVVLHVGRLEAVKGIGVLLKAIPSILERVPRAQFVFVGAARSESQALTWTDRLRKAGGARVKVLGFLDQSELLGWYLSADVVVVPTLNYESFSYTCAQAMAAGLPVVASRIGGIPQTIEDGTSGLLIEPGDSTRLADALVRLLKDPRLRDRLGRAAREKSHADFAADKVARQTMEVYSSLIRPLTPLD